MKAAVVGLGVGERHVAAYQSMDGIELAAVCDADPVRLATIADGRGISRRHTDYREIVDCEDIDIVSVCSYDDAHTEQVCAFLDAGKHVLVEKPMCQSASELEAIQAALASRPELCLSTNLPLRTCPRFVTVRDAVRAGEMGHLYHLEADYLWGRPHKVLQGWRREMDYYSLVLGASVHMIDLVMWLTGQAPVEVSGCGGRKAMAADDLPFDDFVVNVLRFADGTIAKVASHAGCVHPHFHRLAVFGDRRSFFHDLSGAYWVDTDDPERGTPRPESAAYPGREHRSAVIESFVEHIRNRARPPLVTAHDAIETMRVTLAAAEAVEHGSVARIAPD